jgi:2-polyprenyl-3-methyl-5-hydroxy-6-metoxy-1,4-benzoquinol methylase
MDTYKETVETWDRLALEYQNKFMHLNLYNDTYDFLCSLIKIPNAKILDIGCGPGNITKYLLSVKPNFKIFGIDIAPNMVELAKKNNPTASFAIMDSRKIDEIIAKFDAIVCGFCLPYLSENDSQKLITDCYNLLNENGIVYLSFVEGNPLKSGFQSSKNGDRSFFYFHTLDNLKNILNKTNFTNFKTFKVEYNKGEQIHEVHTIIVGIKKAST